MFVVFSGDDRFAVLFGGGQWQTGGRFQSDRRSTKDPVKIGAIPLVARIVVETCNAAERPSIIPVDVAAAAAAAAAGALLVATAVVSHHGSGRETKNMDGNVRG